MSKIHRSREIISTALVLAAMSGGVGQGNPAWGETDKPPITAEAQDKAGVIGAVRDFHIKPQPLSDALKQFSSETHVQLHYSDAAVQGKTTSGIEGSYSVLEAMTRLLTGTGLAFKQSGQEIIIAAEEPSGTQGAHAEASPALAEAWKKFASTMEEERVKTEKTSRFQREPRDRAKAYHALMEAQAMAYNFAVAPRLDYPQIQEATAWQLNTYTLGQNGPDSLYSTILLDGRQTYKLTARIGDERLVLIQVLSHLLGKPDSKLIGNYDLSDLKPGKDGTFEVILSAEKHDGNWIRLDPESQDNWIQIRRWVADWNKDAGEFQIEMVSKPASGYYDYDEFSEDALAKRLESATDVAKYLVESWNIGLYEMYVNASGGQENHMALLPGTATSQVGSPTANYALGTFHINDDEALIVELDKIPADAAYWSFQLGDVWSRSLDFMNRRTSINMSEAAMDTDGKFRAVISREDPGVANWLDTTSHPDGTIVFRNYRSKEMPVPVVRKVAFADLEKYLPKDTQRVTLKEREQRIDYRRQGLIKAYGGVF